MSDAALIDRGLASYFIDWEAHVFGLGYGTGEPHTVPALQAFLALCPPDDASSRNYDYKVLEKALTPTVAWLLINTLGHHHADVIEYGTSPRYGWLTPNGYRLRDFVLSKTPDELVTLVTMREEGHPYCTPDYCNCGPNGEARKCPSPFWPERQ